MAKSMKQLEAEWAFSDFIQSKLMIMEDAGATTKELIEWLEWLEDKAARRRSDLILGMESSTDE